jgi:hypothetical protein
VAIQVLLSELAGYPKTGEAMKFAKLMAVFALIFGLCLSSFSQPIGDSLLDLGGSRNSELPDGHEGPWKPTHQKGARHKGHKGTKHSNPHGRVRH